MKILLIQYKMLGDVLTTSVLLEPLKQKYPTATIDYLIDEPALQVMKGNPFVSNYIITAKDFNDSTLAVFKLAMQLRKSNYDVVIDVYGKLRSQIIVAFSSASRKIAWKKSATSWLYTHNITRNVASKNGWSLAIENRMRLLAPLDISTNPKSPEIYLTEDEKINGAKILTHHGIDQEKPVYMISALGSSMEKTYPLDYMAQLIDFIVQEKPESQILFNYLPSQSDDALNLYESLSEVTKKQVFFDIYADSLRSFLSITSQCDAMIGNEGGAVNMAKALNIKSFILFAPYLQKKNWFSEKELNHKAVHLADYITYGPEDYVEAKKNSQTYYRNFEPSLIFSDLRNFLASL
ncbi:glycosyltransferase family 9 protein [Nonlabens antarcticus]|uniref:glycosyltransferase family 9 protein n=1 Tax=Nonlabens antarcticus TaxID=392714 RepID=UPI001890BA50|nr:glycosyltransferase family 9 protein [Nonlabens antarcticus]